MPPRKYHGPLLPHQRSARVPQGRRYYTASRKHAAARTIGRAWRRYKRRPRLSNQTKPSVETKIIAGTRQIDEVPEQTFTGSNIYQQIYDVADAGANPIGTPLNCFLVPRGVDSNERTGDYLYGKKVMLSLFIQMNQITAGLQARQNHNYRFKVVVCRNRRSKSPYGTFKDPLQSLFLAPNGSNVGSATDDGTGGQLMKTDDFLASLLNKKNFIVYKHFNFTLSPPPINQTTSDANNVGYTTSKQFPTNKLIKLTLPVWSKIHYNNGSALLPINLPDDFDGHFKILIYAMNVPNSSRALNWTTSVRSTFLYNDV